MTSNRSTLQVPNLECNDGNRIPQLGFGVFEVELRDTTDAVLRALRTGYRLVDTAAMYGNEAEVAEGIARSELGRDEVFVTTKVWNDDHGREETLRAFERSLERLSFEWIDLYLIHWPAPAQGRYVETWQAMCELKEEGRVRSIGVSNFLPEHIERISDATGVVPAVNQVELHPRLQQRELRAFNNEHGIVTESWSPLGRGTVLDDPVVKAIAAEMGRSPAQVLLRWNVQLGCVVIPRSVRAERIEENARIFDFALDPGQMAAIEKLDREQRIGPDPATFD
ncbi:MAG: aldo/keto reductase [Solirubrobacterales bacterium]|nr:aldo/keto reductase [Solirubrobacterales bacterium]MBV9165488.1 aldo/keto reductase [Solirubrobacterales bacterium]MBV9533952.1 aldo/keto reductase [Solirubrobacterales bacterium]